MKINSLLSLFSPKDVTFFPLLKESATSLLQSSIYLEEIFLTPGDLERRKELGRLIKEEETKGDKVTDRIVKALNETFITPFDREDINALADEMDDVNDEIYRSSHKISLYVPKMLPDCTKKLAEIIHKGAIEIQGGVNELSSIKKTDLRFKQHYHEIKRLEEEADVIYEEGIMELFQRETDPIELIKLKEIIQCLEKTANKINNTGKVLKTIFVKYA